MKEYQTIAQEAEVEFVEKRSRFLGTAWLITTAQEAADRVSALKKQHYESRHSVFAFDLLDGTVRCSDDGEPQGTAGVPVLGALQKRGLKNTLVVVTRYFGGILLGAGGLSRAYGHTASLALDAAGVRHMAPLYKLALRCSYPQYNRVLPVLQAAQVVEDHTDFLQEVCVVFFLPDERRSPLQQELWELSAGTITLEEQGIEFMAQ